jgi:hypothetical protein
MSVDLMLKIKRAAGEQRGLLLSQEDVSELAEVTRELAVLAEEAKVERRRKQWREGRRAKAPRRASSGTRS